MRRIRVKKQQPAKIEQAAKRGGRGKEKGNGFELLVCKTLSRWISRNMRSDLFARNVLSGGKFTRGQKRNGDGEGIAGDLMSSHPSSVFFTNVINVECKHYKDLGWTPFVYDQRGSSFLAGVIKKCEQETEASGKSWMLIVRQNAKPILVGLHADLGRAIIWRKAPIMAHTMRTKDYKVTFFLLEDFLANVGPQKFAKIASFFPQKETKVDQELRNKSLWERQILITGV